MCILEVDCTTVWVRITSKVYFLILCVFVYIPICHQLEVVVVKVFILTLALLWEQPASVVAEADVCNKLL